MPADWQLPPGVSRGLWEYLHDPAIARQYDARLADTPLLTFDHDFVLAHCPHPGWLIDLGCGTGRLAIPMAQRGYSVLAVDLSEEMLRVVGEKAAAVNVHVDCLKANLVDLNGLADARFDYAACMFHTLGMIAGREARRAVVDHVHRILKPGGVFVLHVHNRWFHLWTRSGRRSLVKNLWNRMRGREEAGDFLMPPHQGIGAMPMHLFSRGEIRKTLTDAGFAIEEIRPISLANDGRLACLWFFGGLRSFGFLVAARKASQAQG